MPSKLEIAKGIKMVGDSYSCPDWSVGDGACKKCPFNRVNFNSLGCISNALQFLEQHKKKIYQWKNINAK